ncbi:Rho GTPase activation protein [Lactarius deliciosus]|nr:Rho GTPase activation protein [Lactarius deliciosus]
MRHEPQSRVFLESHSNSLLTQFDVQLKIIADRYLAFFQERRRIEVSYISSLRKLHREATAVDAPFDPRAEPTTRTAWDKVRDSLEAEAKTQEAFVDILDNDVIKPLAAMKETEDRTRKRVEDGLEESAAKYADYAENTILKLQQAYLKKHHPRQHSQDGSNRRSGNGDGQQEGLGGREPPESEGDDDCRTAVTLLNAFRLKRAEILGDGYDCLEGLVFTPTVKNVLIKYMDGLATTCTRHRNLAMSTSAEVENALAGTDTSDLRASLGHALSFSIPPLTLYCNYRPNAYSNLIFGVPLVNLTTNRDNVPKVIRMCIEEVEKRGLDTRRIYSIGSIHDANVLQLRRRFESEQTFSFGSTDDIHSVAMLLKLYLRDLPEPLITLSLEDCRQYRQNRARYIENDCSVLRSKIRELHPVHRASLGVLLRHLLCVSSHSDKNTRTVEALAAQFRYTVFRGNAILEGGVHAKQLVMEDLIQNAPTLFDGCPQSPAAEWWPPHPGLHQHPEASMIPPSRPESVLSSASDFSLCAASSISGAEFPPSPTASSLSITTDSLPSPPASLLSSMGTSSPTISERI